jgi:hypothetical protein
MGIHIVKSLFRPIPVVYFTRFNIAVTFGKTARKPVHLDPEWLEVRIALFERYCAPKMAAQTDGRFRWLILTSPGTDPAIEKRLLRAPNAEVVPIASAPPGGLLGTVVAPRVAQMGDSIITARVDSDDQLSATYTQVLRETDWNGRRRFAVYFTNGLYFDASSGAYHAVRAPLNQFPAAFEHRPARNFRTVHAQHHNKLHTLMDAILIKTKRPMWCTVVHGGNAANRMSGRLVEAPPENW